MWVPTSRRPEVNASMNANVTEMNNTALLAINATQISKVSEVDDVIHETNIIYFFNNHGYCNDSLLL